MTKIPIGWARVKRPGHGDATIAAPREDVKLRRGAWYPVVQDDNSPDVTLGISELQLTVPRDLLQIRRHQAERFSVVARSPEDPNPVQGTAADLGLTYAVCPTTRARVRLTQHVKEVECPKCGCGHQVAWDQLC